MKTAIIFCFLLLFLPFAFTPYRDFSGAGFAQTLEETIGEDEEERAFESVDKEELFDLRIHPLDLNFVTADDLLVLPKITRKIARQIIDYRKRVGAYKKVKDLLKVPGVSKKLLEEIRPYIKVIPVKEMRKSPWHGDIRFRVKTDQPQSEGYFDADPRYHHPNYFYNRTRLRYGHKYEIGWLTLRDDKGISLTEVNMRKYFMLKKWLLMSESFGLDKLIIGNFKLGYNQGLIFDSTYPGFPRSHKLKARGIQPDKVTSRNENFEGVAGEKSLGPLDLAFFFSDKYLTARLNSDGTVEETVNEIRDNFGSIDSYSKDNLENHHSLREQMSGARVAYNFGLSRFGLMGFRSSYNRKFDPQNKEVYKFQEKVNQVYGLDFETYYKSLNLVAEWARNSKSSDKKGGQVWLFQPMFNFHRFQVWTTIYQYEPDYYNPHAEALMFTPGILMENGPFFKERGYYIATRYKTKKTEIELKGFPQVNYKWPETLDSSNPESSKLPYEAKSLWLQINHKISRKIELMIREWDIYRNRYYSGGVYKYDWSVVKKFYLQCILKASRQFRLRLRWHQRILHYASKTELKGSLVDFKKANYFLTDFKYKPTSGLTLDWRILYFDASETGYVVPEFLWPSAMIVFKYWQPTTPQKGVRNLLILTQKLSRQTKLWIRYVHTRYFNYEEIIRPEDITEVNQVVRSSRHDFRIQYDIKW